MEVISFQPRKTQNLKGCSTSAKDVRPKLQQESHVRSDMISISRLYFESMLVTFIALPSDWKNKFSTNISPDGNSQPPW